MTRLLVPVLFCAAACSEDADVGFCGGSEPATDQYLRVGASLHDASWGSDSTPESGGTKAIDCAVFTLTDVNTGWQVSGLTPSAIDLEPGTYEVRVNPLGEDLPLTSSAVTVQFDGGAAALDVPLCADLSGQWTCEDADGFSVVDATMDDSCTVSVDGLGLVAEVDGLRLNAGSQQGVVDPQGDLFKLRSISGAADWTTCWR